jgi:hypothetical protein
LIVLCIAPDSDDLPRRVALTLGVDADLILANAQQGHDHLVIGSSETGTFAVPTDAAGAAGLLRSFLASGSFNPADLMPPPASVQAFLATH